jgi:signal peptidase I
VEADDTEVLPPAEPEKRRTRGRRQVVEWILLVVGALVVALLIKTFLFQAFYIPSASMVPTLRENDRVLVNKLSYRLHDVHRGDIVVFEAPPGADDGVDDLVKRVIGLPGEEISFRDNRVYVEGEPLDEGYLPEGTLTQPTCDVAETVAVPPGEYWMMGDNRMSSRDSRCFGAIPEDDIIGRVFVRIWPLGRIGFM